MNKQGEATRVDDEENEERGMGTLRRKGTGVGKVGKGGEGPLTYAAIALVRQSSQS